MLEPDYKRLHIFFDCQNLFYSAKVRFGHLKPDFDPVRLSEYVAQEHCWQLFQIHVYTGVHEEMENPYWHNYWSAKLASLGQKENVSVFRRPLRYSTKNGIRVPREKGIDVRIAIDVIRMAYDNIYDVAVIFSQDQDLSEVAKEIRKIANKQNRWIKVASAFPYNKMKGNSKPRGINYTDWIPIDLRTYQQCLDPNNYGN